MEVLTAKQQKERYWERHREEMERLRGLVDIATETYTPTESEALQAVKLVLPEVVRFDDYDYLYLDPEKYKALCTICDWAGIERERL